MRVDGGLKRRVVKVMAGSVFSKEDGLNIQNGQRLLKKPAACA